MSSAKEKDNFPSSPDAEGFYFESSDDAEMGVMTRKYENGNLVKRVIDKDGKVFIVRELSGRDQKHITRFADGEKEKVVLAGLTVATTVDGKPETFEYFEGMKMKFLNKLVYAHTELNF